MRRCPGFHLLTETYAYHCKKGVTYHILVERRGGELSYAVDGEVFLRHADTSPHAEGLVGFRTYQTKLWWDNLRVTALDSCDVC